MTAAILSIIELPPVLSIAATISLFPSADLSIGILQFNDPCCDLLTNSSKIMALLACPWTSVNLSAQGTSLLQVFVIFPTSVSLCVSAESLIFCSFCLASCPLAVSLFCLWLYVCLQPSAACVVLVVWLVTSCVNLLPSCTLSLLQGPFFFPSPTTNDNNVSFLTHFLAGF